MVLTPKTISIEIVEKIKHELVDNCNKRHRLIVGGRAKGASWSIARILLIEGMGSSLFIVCVREVQKTIKNSVHKLLKDTIRRCNLDFFYTVYDTVIRAINGTEFVFYGLRDFNADNIKSLEGADRCWVAEAQSISRNSINILRPTIRKEDSVFWWDFNPRYETDAVWIDYILNNDPHAKVCYANWRDNPWFNEALRQEKESDYSRNTEEADHIWEGVLRNMGDLFVCPSQLVALGMKNNIENPIGLLVVGADIAHQGGDRIQFYLRHGNKVIAEYESRYQDTPTTIQHLKAFMLDKSVILNIDNGHTGAAVADFMERDGYIVNRINFGGTPIDIKHYEDTVTEMYFNLRYLLEDIDIPNDEELRLQLINRKYSFINGKRGYEVMKIESKKEFKEHSVSKFSSPDKADALIMCFYDLCSSGGIATLNYNYM
ncbi:MAG: PBSX family phage terminase large subunit [Candidatus Lokiarchaeota archaeon]